MYNWKSVLCANKGYRCVYNHLILMQTGENLCSLKSRNICIMRRKIFDIYRALRHFNVTADEVDEIARGFKYWLSNPVEKSLPYNVVYFNEDKLYAMPYQSDKLFKRFVGIEIDGVVYLAHFYDQGGCRQDQIKEETENLMAWIAQDFTTVNHFKLRLPTRDEAKVLLEKTNYDESMNFVVCNRPCDVWITPNPDHPERTFATVRVGSARAHRPSEDTRAVLYMVTCPNDEQIFYGKVDKYGVPTPKTRDAYRELYDSMY